MAGIALLSKSFIRVKGPDAAKFLNGLVTTRLSPLLVKKKEHTISPNSNVNENLNTIDMLKNWGVMYEDFFRDDIVRVLRGGVYSMFLNSKGRVVTDCFKFPIPFHTTAPKLREQLEESPNYVVEVSDENVSKLLMLLKIHKLSAKVTIEKASDLHSYYHFDENCSALIESIKEQYFMTETPESALNNANAFIDSEMVFNKKAAENIVGFAIDNRIENYGFKIVTSQKLDDPSEIFSPSFSSKFDTGVTTEQDVRHRRFKDGLFETADAQAGQSLLPFEAGLDMNTGISLNKGCYVGQELTIRTYNLGVIRKRIVPIVFDEDESNFLSSLDLLTVTIERENPDPSDTKVRRGKLGKLLSVDGNLGFMLTAYEDIYRDDRYVAIIEGKKFGFTAKIPSYWVLDEAE